MMQLQLQEAKKALEIAVIVTSVIGRVGVTDWILVAS